MKCEGPVLTPAQRRRLRALAHGLKPVVTTGQAGLSEAVLREIDLSLAHHQLIKVRLSAADREQRRRMAETICRETGSAWVQNIGCIAVIYRPASGVRQQISGCQDNHDVGAAHHRKHVAIQGDKRR